ncbi:MAG: D-alanine--D-alanine ligase [Candidatus Kerfeldbacteria bacterium]|nr:D-alanine--D-alanine ligase [Candidatus Kerfeldbacteria bacterium]
MARKKLRVGVLFGGRSAEHEVSLVSATSVMKNLNRRKYEVVPIGITKAGQWLVGPKAIGLLKAGRTKIPSGLRAVVAPEPQERGLTPLTTTGSPQKLDVVFPVLHGTFGEDGTVQGLLELADIPFVGAGVLGSALGMDKIAQKLVFMAHKLPTPDFVYTTQAEYKKSPASWLRLCLKKIKLPCFVKPANLGSSVGISKAHTKRELTRALTLAFRYDNRVIVERSVEGALEIECSVLGNSKPQASVPGQIVSSNEFYDYDAKYVDGKSQAVIPAPLPKAVARLVRNLSLAAFKALDLAGLARVDFLVKPRPWQVYLNEVNTIPGFTSISMYPKLWQASGLKYPQLIDKLIGLALERSSTRRRLRTSYQPKSAWYR